MLNYIERAFKGHPDKIADQIADTLIDVAKLHNKDAKCAFEVMVFGDGIIVGGETSEDITDLDIHNAYQQVMSDCGYPIPKDNSIINKIQKQSKYIVTNRGEGAGDQGVVWGMASSDTPEYLPKPLVDSQDLMLAIMYYNKLIKNNEQNGKLLLDSNAKTLSVSLAGEYDQESMLRNIKHMNNDLDYNVSLNPPHLSQWHGDPKYDCGMTGRKIIADAYASYLPHGGGAWSGKDMTKVDRSGAYLARELSIEALEKYKLTTVKLAFTYEMGSQVPVSYHIEIEGNNDVDSSDIKKDLDAFFKRETFRDTVKRYNDQNYTMAELADPMVGHLYSSKFIWNRFKGLL
jgi:S-adenosylmethionine synthetase